MTQMIRMELRMKRRMTPRTTATQDAEEAAADATGMAEDNQTRAPVTDCLVCRGEGRERDGNAGNLGP